MNGSMTKLVYCATPARMADKKNKIMDFVTKQGHGPFHPFQAFEYKRFEGGPVGREKTMEFCRKSVDICDELWLFGISEGTLEEMDYAMKTGKPVEFYYEKFDPEWEKHYQKFMPKYLK
jgi:hypothetical protein